MTFRRPDGVESEQQDAAAALPFVGVLQFFVFLVVIFAMTACNGQVHDEPQREGMRV